MICLAGIVFLFLSIFGAAGRPLRRRPLPQGVSGQAEVHHVLRRLRVCVGARRSAGRAAAANQRPRHGMFARVTLLCADYLSKFSKENVGKKLAVFFQMLTSMWTWFVVRSRLPLPSLFFSPSVDQGGRLPGPLPGSRAPYRGVPVLLRRVRWETGRHAPHCPYQSASRPLRAAHAIRVQQGIQMRTLRMRATCMLSRSHSQHTPTCLHFVF